MPSKYVRKGAAPRSVSPMVELTDEFKHSNYTDTITRMLRMGVCTKETADQMLERVTEKFGEGVDATPSL